MSTVQSTGVCPQCGAEAIYLFDCSTRNGDLQCHLCGFCSSSGPEVPEQGPIDFSTWRSEEKQGHGAYGLTRTGGSGCFGSLNERTDEAISWFFTELEKPDIDPSQCWLTRWNDKSKTVEIIYGKPLQDL